jgi:hypothetical protein
VNLSQIFDYGNSALEKRAIFYRLLGPLLDFGRERPSTRWRSLRAGDPSGRPHTPPVEDAGHASNAARGGRRAVPGAACRRRQRDGPREAEGVPQRDHRTCEHRQALNSVEIREGIKQILLNYAGLWEALRARAAGTEQAQG